MNVFFDFDSTLVQAEGLDLLAEISLHGNKEKIEEVRRITYQGMTGELSIQESLASRIKLLSAEKKHLVELIDHLILKISPSISAFKEVDFIFPNSCYVLSGGFFEYIMPVCSFIGFKPENVIANHFIYDENLIVGFDPAQLVSHSMGKAKAIQNLGLKGEIIMVGDGYTDLEVKIAGVSDYYLAYTESVYRESVVAASDVVCSDFHAVGAFLKNRYYGQ